MPKRLDLTGQKFGKLIVTSFSHVNNEGLACWNCLCDCGDKKIIRGSTLKYGSSQSCGCVQKEKLIKWSTKHGYAQKNNKHPLYKVWCGIRRRCNNSNDKRFKDYGGRGIKICERWNKFENFLDDMGPRPKGYTIERINNDGDYCPENCKWATYAEQNKNKRLEDRKGEANGRAKLTTKKVLYIRKEHEKGKKQIELAKELKMASGTINNIIKRRTWKHI